MVIIERTATNAVAPITANTVVPSPRSGLELRPSCIISPNAPDIQQAEHPVIEVWFDDHRRVARIVRKSASGAAKM